MYLGDRAREAAAFGAGAGKDQGLAWLDLFKRIQSAGKGLVVSLTHEEVETAVHELEPQGLFILTSPPSPADAEALLARTVGSVRSVGSVGLD